MLNLLPTKPTLNRYLIAIVLPVVHHIVLLSIADLGCKPCDLIIYKYTVFIYSIMQYLLRCLDVIKMSWLRTLLFAVPRQVLDLIER